MIYPFHYLKKNNFHSRLLIFCICLLSVCLFQTERLNAQEHFNFIEYLESLGDYPDDSLAYILFEKSQDLINVDSLELANELLIKSIEIAQEQHDTILIALCKLRQGKNFNELLNYKNFLIYFPKKS